MQLCTFHPEMLQESPSRDREVAWLLFYHEFPPTLPYTLKTDHGSSLLFLQSAITLRFFCVVSDTFPASGCSIPWSSHPFALSHVAGWGMNWPPSFIHSVEVLAVSITAIIVAKSCSLGLMDFHAFSAFPFDFFLG